MTESRTFIRTDLEEWEDNIPSVKNEKAIPVKENEKAISVKEEDRGFSWMQTFTGKKLDVVNAVPGDIELEDIAHALSMTCRYGGHCRFFYSVAQHSALVATEVARRDNRREVQCKALLHDAAEAYLGDIPSPIKPLLIGFKELENTLLDTIFARFGLSPGIPDVIHDVDASILRDEAQALFSNRVDNWDLYFSGIGATIEMMAPIQAKWMFTQKAKQLGLD